LCRVILRKSGCGNVVAEKESLSAVVALFRCSSGKFWGSPCCISVQLVWFSCCMPMRWLIVYKLWPAVKNNVLKIKQSKELMLLLQRKNKNGLFLQAIVL